jgi:hypothetical protein
MVIVADGKLQQKNKAAHQGGFIQTLKQSTCAHFVLK